jgi:hypothetical protein
MIKMKLCFDAQLLQPHFLQVAQQFYAFSGAWLVQQANPLGRRN